METIKYVLEPCTSTNRKMDGGSKIVVSFQYNSFVEAQTPFLDK